MWDHGASNPWKYPKDQNMGRRGEFVQGDLAIGTRRTYSGTGRITLLAPTVQCVVYSTYCTGVVVVGEIIQSRVMVDGVRTELLCCVTAALSGISEYLHTYLRTCILACFHKVPKVHKVHIYT
jgi:hypothetical protein